MAFVVSTREGRFEVRESHSTPRGPRSRTLSSFRQLDREAIDRALSRASKPLDPEKLRQAAIRAGAPVAHAPIDGAMRGTLRLLSRGDRPDPMLRRLLLDALRRLEHPEWFEGLPAEELTEAHDVSSNARAASAWIGASPQRKGEALVELLGLADALPFEIRPNAIEFPRLSSG